MRRSHNLPIMPSKILVVDDDLHLTNNVQAILEDGGYEVLTAHTAEDGLRLAQEGRPDLAVLDVMIPSMGGWELCRRLRQFSDMPVIFLTALGDVDDVVRGLESGADDYLVKPFRRPELLARIKAHLRRVSDAGQPQRLSFGQETIIIDMIQRSVSVRGESVELTPREFDLLRVLVENVGRVVSARELLRQAWDMEYEQAKDNLKPYIHYLRKKIEEDPAAPQWIVTVRGVGYRFVEQRH